MMGRLRKAREFVLKGVSVIESIKNLNAFLRSSVESSAFCCSFAFYIMLVFPIPSPILLPFP
jgi:hypothetical protein